MFANSQRSQHRSPDILMTPLQRAEHLHAFLHQRLDRRLLHCVFPKDFEEKTHRTWIFCMTICYCIMQTGPTFFPTFPFGTVFLTLLLPFLVAIFRHGKERWNSGLIARKSLASVGLDPADGAIFLRNGQKNNVQMSAHNTMAGFHYIESLPPTVQAILLRGSYLYHVR